MLMQYESVTFIWIKQGSDVTLPLSIYNEKQQTKERGYRGSEFVSHSHLLQIWNNILTHSYPSILTMVFAFKMKNRKFNVSK